MPDRRGIVWVQVIEATRGKGRKVVEELPFHSRDLALGYVYKFNVDHYENVLPVQYRYAKLKYVRRGIYEHARIQNRTEGACT
jgi:hypothetical protein